MMLDPAFFVFPCKPVCPRLDMDTRADRHNLLPPNPVPLGAKIPGLVKSTREISDFAAKYLLNGMET